MSANLIAAHKVWLEIITIKAQTVEYALRLVSAECIVRKKRRAAIPPSQHHNY